jgi:peptide/nickel transport system permease protein
MRFLRQRLIGLLLVLLAVTFFSFLLINLLPEDPTTAILGPGATEESKAQLREDLGLDDPLPVRYVNWLGDSLSGDLGKSYLTNQPVAEAIRERLPLSVELVIYSQLLALVIAIPCGIIAAQRSNGVFDKATTFSSFGLLSIPNFVLAIVLIFIFAVKLDWLPATFSTRFTEDPLLNLKELFLPAVTLAAAELAVYIRLLRTDMLATLQEDYIAVAKAKGMPTRRILLRHAFRPSVFSLVTVAGLNFGRLIGGALIVEIIFAIPGIGSYTVESIYRRDYLAVQGAVVVIAVGYVLINFLVDILYAVLDPRVRHARAVA